MSIPYTFEVLESNEQGAILLYQSPGLPDVRMGTRAPYEGETDEMLAATYAPINYWLDLSLPRRVMSVGASGSFTPQQPDPDNRPPLRRAKDEKLAQLADWRYKKEIEGISLGGSRIRTDRESQATITGAYISLSQGMTTGIDFKTEGGTWMVLNLEQIAPIAQAVVTHVQSCFSAEKQLAAQVEACATVEEVQAVNPPETVL